MMHSKMSEIREHYEVNETGNPRMPYTIKGKRNATYGLMRRVNTDGTPNMDGLMFAINANSQNAPRLLGRNEWVKES